MSEEHRLAEVRHHQRQAVQQYEESFDIEDRLLDELEATRRVRVAAKEVIDADAARINRLLDLIPRQPRG